MSGESFKERVKNVAINNANLYRTNLIGYEYLVCSRAFSNGYHILKSDKGNYLHLIGVHTNLAAEDFFDKCEDGTLEEEDFDFIKPKQDEKSVKGSVRKKIQVLPNMVTLFEQKLLAEDNFKKNNVECAFAATDNTFTLGFAVSGRPKSLLKGNELDKSKYEDVDLVFRKVRSTAGPYTELYYGDKSDIVKYEKQIEALIADEFLIKGGAADVSEEESVITAEPVIESEGSVSAIKTSVACVKSQEPTTADEAAATKAD